MAKFPNSDNPLASPVLVQSRRWIQRDLSISALQAARESGISIARDNKQAEVLASGQSPDYVTRLIEAILVNTDIEIALKVLKVGFIGQVYDLTAGQQRMIIPKAKAKRGYIIINPAEVTGFTSNVTFFPSLLRAPATYTSAAFNVSGVDTARFFLDVTVQAAGATLVVNAQTQDPLTLNWATSQTDIFTGAAAVGTYYASIGPLGVDRNLRLQAVVGVNNETFSISGLLKGGAQTPVGSTVYIGPQDVTTVTGYPILPAQREYFWLWDDVEVYAISPTEPMTIKVFQLQ